MESGKRSNEKKKKNFKENFAFEKMSSQKHMQSIGTIFPLMQDEH